MLTTRWIVYSICILLLINCFAFGQNEIRKAIKAKKNRKVNEAKQTIERGKQHVQDVNNQIRAPIDRANAKINRKYQNARRKAQAIQQIINS